MQNKRRKYNFLSTIVAAEVVAIVVVVFVVDGDC